MLNVWPTASVARQPRGAVKLNDEIITGWIALEVENTATRSADTFRVVFANAQLPNTRDAAWFSRQKTIKVEIFAGLPADPQRFTLGDLDRLIVGQADAVNFDPAAGAIELNGRDLTALLIDTKTSEHFANQTASQIAALLAQRHGLTPAVTATHTRAGVYYQYAHARLTQQQSEWELLSFLANVEDFQVYVEGQALHFEPRSAEQADPYLIAWQTPDDGRGFSTANVIRMQCSRNLTIARDVTVKVHSWNSKQKKGFTAVWPKAAKMIQPGQAAAKTQVYAYTIAGLTSDEAQKRAQSLYQQIIAHEMRLDARLPADSMLDCNTPIEIRGTQTQFDQTYYPESITRTLSIEDGYQMDIRAKNTRAERETV